MPGSFSRNAYFGDAVAPKRRNADVDPSQDDLLVFIHASVKGACRHCGSLLQRGRYASTVWRRGGGMASQQL